MTLLLVVLLLALTIWLLYTGKALAAWVVPITLGMGIWWLRSEAPGFGWWTCAVLAGITIAFLAVPVIRRTFITSRLMPMIAPIFPKMSQTEKEALEAGTVWWDKDLFSGKPDWSHLMDFKVPGLSEEEQAFMDGPCAELCKRIDDWSILQSDDLPEEIWDFMKSEGFLGLIIPKSYGGLGFSARVNGAVVALVSSRSVTAGVTVMVPNSLGPAELLLHYGTEEQKDYYLPRLASGEDIPCFALTEAGAGSDAGAMTSNAVVCRGTYKGEEVLGMRLDWSKRYITLSAVATVIGLAFKLSDPDGLLGGEEDLGITCALIPADTPGVITGERHNPLGVPFINGPTRGEDVFVPIEFIIGGKANAGKGWRMLMQSLAAGRGVSLPGQSCGCAEMTTRTVGAYASIREQFGMPIGKFEGIAERLAPIAGMTYLMDAARWLTAGAIDAGEKPAVITAICKAYMTEGMRDVINHGMDIVGGSGISLGPRNILARAYQAVPVGITVEGANILTRSMIIFGQGAVRCHGFALDEMQAVEEGDVKRFDKAFFGHIGHFFTVFTRASTLSWTRALPASSPVEGPAERYFKQFERMSAVYAVCAEVSMMTLGGALKRKEMLTGRLADGLAWLYLGTAALKRFEDDGQQERDVVLMQWSAEHALFKIQTALKELLDNLPNRLAATALSIKLFPPFANYKAPSDKLVGKVARAILDGGEARISLTPEIYIPPHDELGLGFLEFALEKHVASLPISKKIKDAIRSGDLPKGRVDALTGAALEANIITVDEAAIMNAAKDARWEAVQVDAFGEAHKVPHVSEHAPRADAV
ncbi:MAG: acyl-CoA dehydrogenase [Planctomycetota bacterium]|jgi:acyl-CoA dehydrogenase